MRGWRWGLRAEGASPSRVVSPGTQSPGVESELAWGPSRTVAASCGRVLAAPEMALMLKGEALEHQSQRGQGIPQL